jgi:hypothetical protein
MRGELCSMRLNKSSILKTGHHLFPEASAQAEPHLATIAKRFSALARNGRSMRADECLFLRGDLNRSTQHLLILLDKEVADGDVTDIVHGEAEG